MLTHYIIVRRDLPLGVMAAMVTHASAESAVLFEREVEPFLDWHCRAVVLEVKNERGIEKTQQLLVSEGIRYTLIEESHGPYAGQRMAIGIMPFDEERDEFEVTKLMQDFQLLKKLDEPEVDNDLWGV